jgi:hypothetical protein
MALEYLTGRQAQKWGQVEITFYQVRLLLHDPDHPIYQWARENLGQPVSYDDYDLDDQNGDWDIVDLILLTRIPSKAVLFKLTWGGEV